MAIYIKVPGLTTWMDIGRRDGEGPSKQDPFADGAGCMILGANTKDLDPTPKYGTKECVVECNLGAAAALYRPVLDEDPANVPAKADWYVEEGGLKKVGCQLLMKIVIYPEGTDLNLEQGGANASVSEIIGLTGVVVQGVK